MKRRVLSGLALAALALGLLVSTPISGSAEEGHHIKKAAKGEERAPAIRAGSTLKIAPALSSGLLQAADESLDRADANSGEGSLSVSQSSLGCAHRNPSESNFRVNQDCSFRRQAEEGIAVNPANPSNLVAGQNDSRIGFNHCGIDYTFDSGATWGDQLPPFWQRLNRNPAAHTVMGGAPALRTYDAASDPGIAFDSQGRAFFTCVVFDIADNANGILVASSPVGAGGSFFNNIPTGSSTNSSYVVVEDNNNFIVHDKEFITADSVSTGPLRDNVYVTWTVFKFAPACVKPGNSGGYCSSKIYFSRSTDHAVTWSKPLEISGNAPGICFFGNFFDATQSPSQCDFDQGSDPVVLPNGNIAVVFINENTAATDPNNQQLAVVSSDGGSTWSNPVRVGTDVVVNHPRCDFGRGAEECIPGAYIRTNDFPRLAVNRGNGHLFATWQDYRHGEFDIQLASSTDGGSTWTEAARPVNPDTGMDHYFGAVAAVAGSGENNENENGSADRVGDSYFRTERVANENITPSGHGFVPCPSPFPTGSCRADVGTKNSDYTLSGGRGLGTPYATRRVSPIFGPPDGIQAGFNGDYSGLALVGTTAHPIWSDTRNAAPAGQGVSHDEDVFTDSVELPDEGEA